MQILLMFTEYIMQIFTFIIFTVLPILVFMFICGMLDIKVKYRIKKKIYGDGRVEYKIQERSGFWWFELYKRYASGDECQKALNQYNAAIISKKVMKSEIIKNVDKTVFMKGTK